MLGLVRTGVGKDEREKEVMGETGRDEVRGLSWRGGGDERS